MPRWTGVIIYRSTEHGLFLAFEDWCCCFGQLSTGNKNMELRQTLKIHHHCFSFFNSVFGQIFPFNMPHLALISFLIYLLYVCIRSFPAAINNVSSHLDETTNNKPSEKRNKMLRDEKRRQGDNCEARFICFYSSVVFSAAVCNQHASKHGG